MSNYPFVAMLPTDKWPRGEFYVLGSDAIAHEKAALETQLIESLAVMKMIGKGIKGTVEGERINVIDDCIREINKIVWKVDLSDFSLGRADMLGKVVAILESMKEQQ